MKKSGEQMTTEECRIIAFDAGLGRVEFVTKVAANSTSGRPMCVGYVRNDAGDRVLFCKAQPTRGDFNFYLCNEFESLAPERSRAAR